MSTEIVKIGDATLYHADCREVLPTLTGIDAVVTDPPYGMAFQSNHYKGKGGKPNASKYEKLAGDLTPELLRAASSIEAAHAKYIFCRWNDISEIPPPRSLIAWVKPNWSMGDLEHEHGRQYEVIAFYPGPSHKWPHKRPPDVVMHGRSGNERHPTEKPVSLMQEVVSWTSGKVLDCFMGSGTTGVACANLGREFVGIEIERRYFDIACERIAAAYSQGRLFA